LFKRFASTLISASLIFAPALGVSAFAQTAAPAGAADQQAQPITPAPKAMKKKPAPMKTAQKAPKHMKAAPKAKAPPASGQGDQPSDQE
jgi:hypothetical protein